MRIHSSAILYFDAVRRAGSIREASRKLNVASSAVNRQILKLEEEIGAALFERNAAGVALTTAGEMLARHVIVVMQDLERARSDIEALRGARLGHISIAAVEGVAASLLPDVILRMRAIAPRVCLTTRTMGSRVIPSALVEGTADVGIAFSLGRSPLIRQAYVARFKLGAILAPKHPLARRSSTNVAACCDYPLVGPGSELSIAAHLEPLFQKIGRVMDAAVVADSIELMRQLAMHTPMIGFQTRIGMEHSIAEGRLVHVPLDEAGPVWSELGVYVRAGRSLPAAVELFLQILTRELQDHQRIETEQHEELSLP